MQKKLRYTLLVHMFIDFHFQLQLKLRLLVKALANGILIQEAWYARVSAVSVVYLHICSCSECCNWFPFNVNIMWYHFSKWWTVVNQLPSRALCWLSARQSTEKQLPILVKWVNGLMEQNLGLQQLRVRQAPDIFWYFLGNLHQAA